MKPPTDASGVELPSYDPWDGDPSEFEAIASALVTREAHTSEVRIGVSALLNDPALQQWMGRSADAFRATLGPLPGLLNQLGNAYFHAAGAVRAYAGKLRDGQASFARLQTSLQSQVTTNPANADGRAGAASALAVQANQASSEHDQAKRACAKAVSAADDDVRRVRAALADKHFSDFTATFTSSGGNIADLVALQHFGGDLYTADLDSIKATLNDQSGGLPPEVLRSQIQDFLNEFGDVPQAWGGLGPLLGQIPGYLDKNDKLPDGSLPPEDQALLTTLGRATAKAAAAGNLTSVVANASDSDLLGLSTIVAAAGGGMLFGKGTGAQFLADLVTKMTDRTTKLPFNGPIDVYNKALLQDLQAATADGDAVRLALSGPEGRQLVTQLLEGSAPIAETVGAYTTTTTLNEGSRLTNPDAVAAFLNAAVMQTRGNDPASEQTMQAALNVVMGTSAFSSWDPSNNEHIYTVGQLPDSIGAALRNYATANMYDLAISTSGSSFQGVSPHADIPGGLYDFTVSNDDAQAFLKVALQNPHDAMAYQSLVEKQYTKAVADAIRFGPISDVTPGYANLVTSAQSLIDQQKISPAQQIDARNANHLLIMNMLGGAFGNAPGPESYAASTALGAGQSLEGLMQPAIGGGSGPIGRFFDTSHVAQVQASNHAADLSLVDSARLLATQGAYDAGALIKIDHQPGPNDHLPPGGIWIGPGMVDSNGKIQNSAGFQDWWVTGQNPDVGQSGQPLSHYVDQIQKAMTIHQ